MHDKGDQPVSGVSLATMNDLSARLEQTRPEKTRVPESLFSHLRWTILRSTLSSGRRLKQTQPPFISRENHPTKEGEKKTRLNEWDAPAASTPTTCVQTDPVETSRRGKGVQTKIGTWPYPYIKRGQSRPVKPLTRGSASGQLLEINSSTPNSAGRGKYDP